MVKTTAANIFSNSNWGLAVACLIEGETSGRVPLLVTDEGTERLVGSSVGDGVVVVVGGGGDVAVVVAAVVDAAVVDVVVVVLF